MKATSWEFKNRALVFGLMFALGFSLYSLDHENSTGAFADWLGPKLGIPAEVFARLLLGCAALLLALAALIRTWASSYLEADVVYADRVKSASLVADGPYRHVRNPLYFANQLVAIGMGAMMSRVGCVVLIAAMLIFCYRLIFREESELGASQGGEFERFRKAVPRLWPSIRPRIASAGRQAKWSEGFKSEFWCWGFAASVAAFAITLNNSAFFGILAASVVLLWLVSMLFQKRAA